MQGLTKGLLGAGVASLLAWGTHAMDGANYIDTIETDMQGALASAGVEGASLSMQRDPLSRIAIVDGVTDPDERARIEAMLIETGKVSHVRWANDRIADAEMYSGELASADGAEGTAADLATGIEDTSAVTGASEEQVADCQSGVDAFMDGKSILFQTGSAYLAEESIAVVDGLSERLTVCTGMSVTVGGHTDATGTDSVNMSISQARADAVASALAERGVSTARITAIGYGSSQPAVEGDGANAANRRIEFTLDAGADAQGGE
ncbi:MAG: OmpA family protein [Erythrobacter sp.]